MTRQHESVLKFEQLKTQSTEKNAESEEAQGSNPPSEVTSVIRRRLDLYACYAKGHIQTNRTLGGAEVAPQKGKGSSHREREKGIWPEEEQEVDVRTEEK